MWYIRYPEYEMWRTKTLGVCHFLRSVGQNFDEEIKEEKEEERVGAGGMES